MATLSDIITPTNVLTATNTQTVTNKTFTSLTTSGNLTFTGTGNRITGDFSNATLANRTMFQNSVTNGATSVAAMPNGTGANSAYNIFASSDPTNSSFGQFRVGSDTSDVRITSGIAGTGTYLPMTFFTGGSERVRITTAGGFSVGTTADPGVGAIFATGNVTAYYSDDRLKTKFGNIENALDKVETLSGFYYEANETAQALGYKPKREVGVSAQQVQAVMPEVVSPAPIDQQYLTVDYERLVPLLIEAIKELRAEVRALKGT